MARSKFSDRHYNAKTGEWSPEFNAFYEAVGEATQADYDSNQICDALGNGWTVEQAVEEIEQTHREKREDFAQMKRGPSWAIENQDHDYSMNA